MGGGWTRIERRVDEFADNVRRGSVLGLIQLLDLKDLYTGVHSTQLVQLALAVAQRLEMSTREMEDLEIGATLHDIGKVGVPDAILHKPTRLTEEELALVRRHPEFGWQVTHVIPGLERASLYILHHHERWDGRGYPGGLKGPEIPLGARIVAAVDAFAAMTTSRSYRVALPPEEGLQRLRSDSALQFDPQVVNCFVELARLIA
jgi:HD-GYP domain-containing protein (c-di-GMP phosphodiesterase class II)